MIRVGIVGIGFMGMIHYLAYQRVRGMRVSAICTRNRRRLAGDWRGIQGNFGPPGTKMDLGPIGRYADLDDLLADENVDLVDICLPPALHASVALRALRAGKHVFCEKPIALDVASARRMLRAAEQHNRQLLIGHVLPFFPEYAFALQAIRSGRYGRLLRAHFKRTISEPLWIKDFFNPQTVGGPVVDLHIHDAHFIRLVGGMPERLFSRGRLRGDVVEYLTTQFVFPRRDLLITAEGGVIPQQGRPFTHGFEIQLEKATLVFDFAVIDSEPVTAMPLTVLGDRGRVTRPTLRGGDDPLAAFVAELKEVSHAIRRGEPSPLLDGRLAADALTLCHKQTRSVQLDRPVRV